MSQSPAACERLPEKGLLKVDARVVVRGRCGAEQRPPDRKFDVAVQPLGYAEESSRTARLPLFCLAREEK